MFIWVMSNEDRKVSKLVQSYRSQEPSSFCLLLTSYYLLDSLIAEVIVRINFSDLNRFCFQMTKSLFSHDSQLNQHKRLLFPLCIQ